VLQCFVVCCSVLQRVAACCSVLVTNAGNIDHCNTHFHTAHIQIITAYLQYTATHCNILQHSTNADHFQRTGNTAASLPLQHTATHCNTLQHTATHCNTLPNTATCCNIAHMQIIIAQRQYKGKPSSAIHCNTLQHTATCCNTLRQTATQRKYRLL